MIRESMDLFESLSLVGSVILKYKLINTFVLDISSKINYNINQLIIMHLNRSGDFHFCDTRIFLFWAD